MFAIKMFSRAQSISNQQMNKNDHNWVLQILLISSMPHIS